MADNKSLVEKVLSLQEKFESLQAQLSDPGVMSDMKKYVQLNKDYKELEPIIAAGQEYKRMLDEIAQAKDILANEKDEDLREMAREELADIEPKIPDMEQNIKLLLIPADPDDGKNAIVEIRGGAGGDEAAIFAGDLFRMYAKYCETKGWKVEITDQAAGTAGGFKIIVFKVSGENVYGTLKYESGVHRVQRVPQTETQGRIHTSAATVAVMPEAEDVDVDIKPEDLRIDVYRASGAGGQYVNRTETAIRITHLPTGMVVECQDERSQFKNRDKAMKVLKSRLLNEKREAQSSAIAAERKAQVGTGDRNERIRTYNFPQSRVTDHRIGLTLYKIDQIINGGLDEVIDPLITADRAAKMESKD